jgi:hypothetical protein
VHVAPTCAGSGEGSDHFGSYVRSIFLYFCKRFPGLEPTTSWSQGNNFTTVPGSPSFNKKSVEISAKIDILEIILVSSIDLIRKK